MSLPWYPLRSAYFFLTFSLILPSLVVQARPKVRVTADADLSAYRKVYLAQMKTDVAKVYPGVLNRLRESGFDVVELKPGSLPFVSQGSGFILDPQGYVLTCAHVVGPESLATLWVQGARYTGHVIALDTNLDAGVIQIDEPHPQFHSILFASEPACHMGDEVFTMGFPLADMLGITPRLNKGLVSSTAGLHDDPRELQVSAEVQAGNSGGPLLNSRGQALGMVSSTLNPLRVLLLSGGDLPQNVNFAIKKDALQVFLRRSNIPFENRTNAPAVSSHGDFDEVAHGLALIRAGLVDEERFREQALLCRCNYVLVKGYFYRLRVDFIDIRKLKIVLTASLEEGTYSSQNSVLDHVFQEVGNRFFPERAAAKKKK